MSDYEAHGGWAGLRRALGMSPRAVVDEVTESGLRGRGGAGFPAGIKWKTVLETEADQKFVACNFDEGDSGTFADRMIVEGDPFTLVEGMTIAAHAVGASEGYVYVRSEYPHAVAALRRAIDTAYTHGFLGRDILGSGLTFDLHVRVGAGAYICGEESSMLDSLEGRRGEVRAKPPIPAVVRSLRPPDRGQQRAHALRSADDPHRRWRSVRRPGHRPLPRHARSSSSPGTSGTEGSWSCRSESPWASSSNDYGGGTLSGRPVRAVQVGGPLAAYVPPEQFGLPMDYEALAEAGAMVGHGGIVVFDDTVDMARMARFAMEFCAAESCGKCTPCRIGSARGVETIDRIIAGHDVAANLVLLDDLCETLTKGSLCAMGGLTPMPVQSALRHWPEDFDRQPEGADS